MSMKVIPPMVVTTSNLTSSTAAEPGPGETAWSAATSYAVAQIVVRSTTHRRYSNLIAGVDATLPENAPSRWFDIGPTNQYAMFDILRNTATVQASPLTVVLTPGQRIDSLALLGLVATGITVTMTSGGTTVYSYTANLNTRDVLNWYDYFFRPFSTQGSVTLFDLPPYTNGVLTIALTNTAGAVQCGSCVMGLSIDIGDVQYSAESDVLNFSTVTRTADGAATMVQNRNVPKTVQSIFCAKANVNRVRDLRDSLNGAPAVWVGIPDSSDGYAEAMQIVGFYRRFTINLQYPQHAVISLELEEV